MFNVQLNCRWARLEASFGLLANRRFTLQPSEPSDGFFALRKWMAGGCKQNFHR
jgi:hypothetical protein